MKPKKKFSLVIVDVQYDFCNPNGSLFVPGSENLPDKIVKFIDEHADEINEIIFTQDWHPYYAQYFDKFGGQWPVHCVAESIGASIPSKLIFAARKYHTQFLKKGKDEYTDEYGAFATNYTIIRNHEEEDGRFVYRLGNAYCPVDEAVHTYNDTFVVCGLCGDYCVQESIKNLRKNPNFDVYAALDLIGSIDGGESLNNYIKETNLKIFE